MLLLFFKLKICKIRTGDKSCWHFIQPFCFNSVLTFATLSAKSWRFFRVLREKNKFKIQIGYPLCSVSAENSCVCSLLISISFSSSRIKNSFWSFLVSVNISEDSVFGNLLKKLVCVMCIIKSSDNWYFCYKKSWLGC